MALRPVPVRPVGLGSVASPQRLFWILCGQVALVGATLGQLRTVLPLVAEAEFGIPRHSWGLMALWVVAFGGVKAAMNAVAGQASERWGRRPVLLVGWMAALPVPLLVGGSSSWAAVVLAAVCLAVQQGLCWSMTQTAQIDLVDERGRGRAMGLNESAGYLGLAVSGAVAAALADAWGGRTAVCLLGLALWALGFGMAWQWVAETRPYRPDQPHRPDRPHQPHRPDPSDPPEQRTPPRALSPQPSSVRPSAWWAVLQAGLVEKFVDALMWMVVPLYLVQQGVGLAGAGAVTAAYGAAWGLAQWWTGPWSDRVGRRLPAVAGMGLCAVAVAVFPWGTGLVWWTGWAVACGLGMALLYPSLGAAAADLAPPAERGAWIGQYRFWRDFGYAVGAVLLAGAAQWRGHPADAFWAVALCMAASAGVLHRGAGATSVARAHRAGVEPRQ